MPPFQSCDFIVPRSGGGHWSSFMVDSLLTGKEYLSILELSRLAEPEDNLLTLIGQTWTWKLRELTCAGPGVSFDNPLDYSSCQETPVPCRPLRGWRQSLAPCILIISVAYELEMMGGTPTSTGVFREAELGVYYIFSWRHGNIYPADVITFGQSHCLQPFLLVCMHCEELPLLHRLRHLF